MATYTGNYKAKNGKDYFSVGLNINNSEIAMFKNFSCDARRQRFVSDNNLNFTHFFFNHNEEKPAMNNIPKKYHKFFNS